jgi:hypothetical protein
MDASETERNVIICSMAHPLEIKVALVRRRVRRLFVVYGASRVLAIVVPAVFVLGGIDYLLRFEDHGVRVIWSLTAAAIAAWAIVRYLLPALQQRLGPVAIAQRIEAHFAGLGDQLSSAIEFLGEQSNDPYAGSALLRRAAVAQTQARIGPLDWSNAIDRRPAVRAAVVAGMMMLIAAATFAFRPNDSLLAILRLANPLGSAAWPPTNDLAFTRRIERLAVGQPFEVELIDRNRNLPEEVRILYRYTTDSGDEQIEREPMQPVGDVMTARKERVVRSFDYRAEGGDDHKMAWTHVEVVESPRIQSIAIRLHPPAYTGWPVEPAERRIVALRGTTVEIHATTSKPLASAILHQQHGPDVIARLTGDGRGFVIAADAPSKASATSLPTLTAGNAKQPPPTGLVIENSGAYWFELRDREGLIAGPEDRWEIQAIADQPPSVNLQQPAGNLLVTPGATVPIKIAAKDDLAIHTIDLIYTRSDHTETGDTAIRLFTGPDRAAAPASLTAGRLSEGQSEMIDYSWELAPLKLPPGTHVLLTATAADYRPQAGTSAPRRLTVITPQELEDHLAQRESLIFNELARILKMQQAARLETTGLEATLERVGRFEKADIDQLRGDELSQRQVRRSLASSTEGARAQIVALLGELTNNKVPNLELRGRMQSFADEIARLDREELPAIESELTTALKGAEDLKIPPSSTVRRAVQEAGRNQDAVVSALEKMLERLGEWNSIRGVSRELLEIRREQNAIEKDTKDLGAQTLTKDPQDLTPEQLSELRKLSVRQFDLGRQFEKLEQRMDQVAEQIKSVDPNSADAIADAARSARDHGIAGLMRDAGSGVEQNQIGQTLGRQDSARRGLDEMLDILSNRHEQELARLVQKLREAEAQLAGIRKQQEGLRKQIKDAGDQKDEQEGRKQLERLSRTQQAVKDEVDRLTRQLQRMQADKPAASLARAGERMGQTSKSAAGGDGGGAEKNSEAADKDLDEAQEQLAEARRKAENDLANEQLARLEDSLKGLVDRQQHTNDETLRLEKLRAAAGQWTRSQSQSLHDLAGDEQSLADETTQLAEKLAGAETFHFVLDAAAREMTGVAGRLKDRDCGAATQELEQNVLSRLKQLVEATKPEKPGPGEPQAAANGPGGGGQPPGGSIRALAEVRLIRLMQEDLNRRTGRLNDAIGDRQPTEPERAELAKLGREQGQLAELMLALIGGKQ